MGVCVAKALSIFVSLSVSVILGKSNYGYERGGVESAVDYTHMWKLRCFCSTHFLAGQREAKMARDH
jgi:hypothetical protein